MQSRIRKLSEGVCSATLLALAGLKRLDLEEKATAILSFEEMLPAVAQACHYAPCRCCGVHMSRRPEMCAETVSITRWPLDSAVSA